jgi:hypothetical protein
MSSFPNTLFMICLGVKLLQYQLEMRMLQNMIADYKESSVNFPLVYVSHDRLCGLVVKVPGYRYGGPGFDSSRDKKVVGLERGPLSLVSTTNELLGSNSSGSGLESREYGRRDSSR